MQERIDRKAVVTRIINSEKIRTQEALLVSLSKEGIEMTQATLSRDMKQLGAVKMNDANGSYYMIPDTSHTERIKGLSSVEMSGQLCVIRCRPGFASALGAVLDNSHIPGVMGCIAGDDTILVMMAEDADKQSIKQRIKDII